MNNYEFVKFAANRFGIDETLAESMVDMFAQSLQELVAAGQSVTIDEIGEFKSVPLFPNGLNHHNNIALAKAAKRNIVSFRPSENLTKMGA
ncbi:MAG: HU family DNA-binding protein [Rickettsiaceae bacterium]|jgi:nucleoid DNA-binding protein|nr:HU family DNA-binding protein [Rickettsiaceae bacterium]